MQALPRLIASAMLHLGNFIVITGMTKGEQSG